MENQGYEEEVAAAAAAAAQRSSLLERRSMMIDASSLSANDRSRISAMIRNDPEMHVYEDIGASPNFHDSIRQNSPPCCRLPIRSTCHESKVLGQSEQPRNCWSKQDSSSSERTVRKDDELLFDPGEDCSPSLGTEDDTARTNFHRNLTLPSRRRSDDPRSGIDDSTRFSVRVTNRERRTFSSNEDHNCLDRHYESPSVDSARIRDLHELRQERDDAPETRVTHDVLDKPGGRRRRKRDCKHCKSGNKAGIAAERFSTLNTPTVPDDRKVFEREEKSRLLLGLGSIVASSLDKKPAMLDPARTSLDSTPSGLFRLSEAPKDEIFSIGGNLDPSQTRRSRALDWKNNETGICLVAGAPPIPEINDDRALITPEKNRTNMKVNSIYSQQRYWSNSKDLPIFASVTPDLKEQSFQRAYSLPTRTHTPSSQNRLNLRRSVRGEPPPHPARLRKNPHGWTLHFARPLDATGSTRSIVLLLIAVLALLGIGGIALYIVFEPEKLEIIQQYLRSSAPMTNTTSSTERINTTLVTVAISSELEANMEMTTLPATPSVTWSEDLAIIPREPALTTEPEMHLSETSTEPAILDSNVTRHCDDCYRETEVCVALVDEDVPICRTGPDPTDPTGCNGLCLINKQKCHRLDFDAFRCVEVEHYCLDDEWTCANTLCIPLIKHCDGHMNCYDHSDEYDCVCNLETHFQCSNETSCLPIERRCDGKIDCWDATDEINCTTACPSSSQFTCSDGECILKARFCDGLRDCTDGSDEPHGCQGRCNKHEFSCLNGRCIPKSVKCNGIDDCGDNSDEQHCREQLHRNISRVISRLS